MTWTAPKNGMFLTVRDIFDCLRNIEPSIGRIVIDHDYGLDPAAVAVGVASYCNPRIIVKTERPVPHEVQDKLAFWKPLGILLLFSDDCGGKRVVPDPARLLPIINTARPFVMPMPAGFHPLTEPEIDFFTINRESS